MSRALVVHAHPEPNSFTAAMRDTVCNELGSSGYTVDISDLYQMKFNPLLTRDDFSSLKDDSSFSYTKEQRHGFANGTLAPDIACEAQRVLAADLLVLVFPIYWFSAPAILKGWFDRVLLAGPMYGGRTMYDQGGLVGKRALVVASLGGREHMFGQGAVHGDLLTGMLSHILRGTLGVVGYQVLEPYFAYHAPYVSNERRTELLADLAEAVRTVDRRASLKMPSLTEFDEKFRPRT